VSKPLFEIDTSRSAQSSLEAHLVLAAVDPGACDHLSQRLRLPLGIYNLSISRITERLLALCKRLEMYFKASPDLSGLGNQRDLRIELLEFMELSIYAAAEHVDDIDSIARGFFRHGQRPEKNAAYRQLNSKVRSHKRYLSTAANAIKHSQSRLRLYSCEFRQAAIRGCLHGYFVEGVEDGVVGPNRLLHKDQDVFSVTTLIWEIITFVLQCSRDLRAFLASEAAFVAGPVDVRSERFATAVVAAARLPLYTFGEEHPFSRSTVRIVTSSSGPSDLDSKLYGSIKSPWSIAPSPVFGPDQSEFEGDGCSRHFRFCPPEECIVHQWQ
jgi:hypothetical protein